MRREGRKWKKKEGGKKGQKKHTGRSVKLLKEDEGEARGCSGKDREKVENMDNEMESNQGNRKERGVQKWKKNEGGEMDGREKK